MEKLLQQTHRRHDLVGRGRDVSCISRPGTADPVLCPPELAGGAFGAAAPAEKALVDLSDKSQAERKVIVLHPIEAMVHRVDVVSRLSDVPKGNAGGDGVLEQQQVGERRLRSLDLRRKDRLLPDIRVEELIGIRKKEGDPIKASKRLIGGIQQILHLVAYVERGSRRQRLRVEGKIGLARGCVPDEFARPRAHAGALWSLSLGRQNGV